MIIYSLKIVNVIHLQYSLKKNNMLCFYGHLTNHTKAEYIQLHYCNKNSFVFNMLFQLTNVANQHILLTITG